MATAEIKFYVLDVGQGACNYVEIIDGNGDVAHNMLIDLGTNSSQTIAADNLQWLRQKIIDNKKYLDVLILTHGDTDHYNMIAKILPAFGAPNHEQIGMTRYGGPAWRYKNGDLITTLATYTKFVDDEEIEAADIGSFKPSQSSFDLYEDPQWEPIWSDDDDDAKLQLIIANTPHPRDPASMVKKQPMNAEAVNTKSVVLGLEWDGHWIVATGDATATTLEAITDLLEHVDHDQLPDTFMMTLPHHGSRKTTYDLALANNLPTNAARGVVDDFLDKFEPFTMSISAGEKRHHHPSAYMIEQFAEHLDPDKPTYWSDPACANNRHFLTSWVDQAISADDVDPAWPARWQYATTQTRNAMFSTLYFNTQQYNAYEADRYIFPPNDGEDIANAAVVIVPQGRNWQFSMDEDNLNVDSSENAARAQAARADFIAATTAPPPSVVTAPGRAARTNLTAPVVTRRPDDALLRRLDSGAPSLRGLRTTE